jgi:hypothetical protein
MKNAKATIAAVTMMVVMVFGTTLANAGIIIARSEPCKVQPKGRIDLTGIIIAGIIIAKTGIIIARTDPSTDTCGK